MNKKFSIEIKDLSEPFKKAIEGAIENNEEYLAAVLFNYDGQPDKALEWLDKIPHHEWGKSLRGKIHLARGNYKEGFALYENRYSIFPHIAAIQNNPPKFWNGNPTDKPLAIWCEGGDGDIMMMSRFLPLVYQKAPNLIVLTSPELASLFEHSGMPGKIVTKLDVKELIDQQAQKCSYMSLPYLINITSIDQISLEPYLKPRPEIIDKWQHYSNKIGFFWTGDNNDINIIRSLSPEAKQMVEENLDVVPLYPQYTGAKSWEDTAGIMLNLKAVITTDCGPAHLAGALGIPTYLLLSYAPDWRWQSHSWYKNIKNFRCPRHGDWQTPIQELINILKDKN